MARPTSSGNRSRPAKPAPTSQSARAPSAFSLATPPGPPSARNWSALTPRPPRNRCARLPRHSRIDQVACRPHRDIITAERRRYLVRRRRAPDEPQQRPVINLALPDEIETGPPGQLGREQARAHRLAGRMTASQVTRHRQRRDHAAHPHQITHSRKSTVRARPEEINPHSTAPTRTGPEHTATSQNARQAPEYLIGNSAMASYNRRKAGTNEPYRISASEKIPPGLASIPERHMIAGHMQSPRLAAKFWPAELLFYSVSALVARLQPGF